MLADLLDDFMVRAGLTGIGVALAAGPMGCFVVWRRMAYFGDATAHAAILGVALALFSETPVMLGVLLTSLVMAGLVSLLAGRTQSVDTILGVLAHAALALGLVAVALLPGVRVDLMSYLFGEILAVDRTDLALIWGGAALIVIALMATWSGLVLAILNPDLARAEGVDPFRAQAVFTLGLALMVALAIKVVGALLIAALMLIPAAAARPFARTPETMAVAAALIGAVSAFGGLHLSAAIDTPTGPTIVALATAFFAATTVARALAPLGRTRPG